MSADIEKYGYRRLHRHTHAGAGKDGVRPRAAGEAKPVSLFRSHSIYDVCRLTSMPSKHLISHSRANSIICYDILQDFSEFAPLTDGTSLFEKALGLDDSLANSDFFS